AGRISRPDIRRRGVALGLSAPILAGLAQEGLRGALAQERNPIVTFYNWMTNNHPTINTIAKEQGVTVQVAPTTNFGNDRFIAEAKQQKSTWDMYGGGAAFLEVSGLVAPAGIRALGHT